MIAESTSAELTDSDTGLTFPVEASITDVADSV